MSLISLLITIAVIGVIAWAIESYVPMDDNIRKMFRIAAVVGVVIYLCVAFGVCGHIHDVQVPRLN